MPLESWAGVGVRKGLGGLSVCFFHLPLLLPPRAVCGRLAQTRFFAPQGGAHVTEFSGYERERERERERELS